MFHRYQLWLKGDITSFQVNMYKVVSINSNVNLSFLKFQGDITQFKICITFKGIVTVTVLKFYKTLEVKNGNS